MKPGGFSGAAEGAADIFKQAGKSVVNTAMGKTQNPTTDASKLGSNDASALQNLEQNAQKNINPAQSGTNTNQNPLAAMGDQQKVADDQKLAQVRKALNQLHRTTYYIPTFEQKPKQIKEKREQEYQARFQQEEKKKQEEAIEEKKKKDDIVQKSMRTRKEGEGGKLTG